VISPILSMVWRITARITNRLEAGHCISNMIHIWIGNLPLHICDLWINWRPAVVFLLDSHSLYRKILKKKHWIFTGRLLCWKNVWTNMNTLHQYRTARRPRLVRKQIDCNDLAGAKAGQLQRPCRRDVPLS